MTPRHPTDPVYYIPVPGTWAFKEIPTADDWYHGGSKLSIYLGDCACFHVKAQRPFEWTGDVGGHQFWRRWFNISPTGDHRDWLVAGRNLCIWIASPVDTTSYVNYEDRRIVCHSHALQVVLYACAQGLKINKLISIAGPVRRDMMEIATRARGNIGQWVHVHSDRSDRTQWFGEFGDGVLGVVRKHPLADYNIAIPGVGHSDILNKPDAFHWWKDAGLIDYLRS